MEFDNLIKLSGKEVINFTKRNAERFAIVADLIAARDNCNTKGARALIQTLIAPMQKDVQRECANFDAKMSAIWKKAKGETVPKETQKKLDGLFKSGEKSFKSKSGQDIRYNGKYMELQWIGITSFSI